MSNAITAAFAVIDAHHAPPALAGLVTNFAHALEGLRCELAHVRIQADDIERAVNDETTLLISPGSLSARAAAVETHTGQIAAYMEALEAAGVTREEIASISRAAFVNNG